jgi:hypothetical protein
MLNEKDLKIGGKYLYWSPSKMQFDRVTYVKKRPNPSHPSEEVFVFRLDISLNEIWAENLINIAVDDGWYEKFARMTDDDESN